MKITFDKQGKNYVEFVLSSIGKYQMILSTESPLTPASTIVSSAELTLDQLLTLMSDWNLIVSVKKGKE